MTNSIYLGLVNSNKQSELLTGSDFVPAAWNPRELSTDLRTLRTGLFGVADVSEAVHWRAAELLTLLPNTDLASFATYFDVEVGYHPSTIIDHMSSQFAVFFRDGDFASKFKMTPRITTPLYTVHELKIHVTETTWRVDLNTASNEGQLEGKQLITTVLPGDVTITFATNKPTTQICRFATPPTRTLAAVAKDLRSGGYHGAMERVAREPSVIPAGHRRILQKIMAEHNDPASTSLAVALMLAGATLSSPVMATV